jgi:uncharacterized protein
MQIQVTEIPVDGVIKQLTAPVNLFPELKKIEAEGEYQFISDIYARLAIRKVLEIIEIEGWVAVTTTAVCSRCLSIYRASIDQDFSLDFTPEISEPDTDAEEIALGEEDLGIIHFSGNTIELKEAIQEQVILGLPLRPLCREDCKGLCHSCGENLNEGKCRCSQKNAIDPRFAVLKNFNPRPQE